MTGSYFHKKILVFGVLLSVIFGTFLPIEKVFAIPTSSGLQQQADSGQMKKVNTGTPAGSEGTNESIYCIKATGFTDAWFPEIDLSGCIANVTYLILQAASWVLWVAAILFNVTINYTLNMATFIKDVPIVSIGWTTFRDIANIFFVFLVLYIAINTIIGNEGYGIKKLLGKVIVAAMFINFSLFFTQAMIDASNIFALQFYNSITQGTSGQTTKGSSLDKIDSGISAAFVNAMGFQQILYNGSGGSSSGAGIAVDSAGSLSSGGKTLKLNAYNLITVSLGGTVLIIVTAFVFFAATFMFIARAVTLMFLMILSPLAFLGAVLPALGEITKKWWSQLFNNLLFAPAYMALLYLVIGMITSGKFKGVGGSSSFYELFSGSGNVVGVILTFLVLNALMIGCLLIASSLGAKGSGWAEKTGKGLATSLGMAIPNFALGAGRMGLSGASNVGAGVGRGLAGKIGDSVSGNKFLARMSTKPGFGRLAAYTLQQGDKLKDKKIGGKSFNEQVKEEQKNYTKRGNLIEKALLDVGEKRAGESDADYKKRKQDARTLAGQTETAYLSRGRFTYASKSAIKKAKKASQGTDNKEALQNLLDGKYSQQAHNDAKRLIEEDTVDSAGNTISSLNSQIAAVRAIAKNPASNHRDVQRATAQLGVLLGEKKELQDIVDGHLRTVEKLANLDSK